MVVFADECRIDVVFVLDGSGSVMQPNWELMLQFVENFTALTDFRPQGTRVGVVSFGNDARIEVALDEHSDLDSFQQDVDSIPWRDENTNTASGIRLARGMFLARGDTGILYNLDCRVFTASL